MRALNNSTIAGFAPKSSDHASPDYSVKVARPIMQAVDGMPSQYRALVNEFGYISVYNAWRRGWTVQRILDNIVDGKFEL